MPRNIHPIPYVIRPAGDLVKRHPELRRMNYTLAELYADEKVAVTEGRLKTMGRVLWNVLDLDASFDAAVKEAGTAILSVIIESDQAEVQALPWETLHHPVYEFIGKNHAFTLTRRIAEGKSNQRVLEKGPLRVLLFSSLPENVNAEHGRLKVEEEQTQVQEALLPWISKGMVRLEMPDDGRFFTLKEWLKNFDPHVLFMSGHGKFHHEPHTGEPPYGEFLFESEIGDGEPIRDEEIVRAFVGTRVQMVILSACESGKASSDALSSGLMQKISTQGIPHVIGMRESILDSAGIQFARALCDELAGREQVDVALQSARIAIQTPLKDTRQIKNNNKEEFSFGQWCLPMALSPNPQTPLIDWEFALSPVKEQLVDRSLNNVNIPPRFIGRRKELRRFKKELQDGSLRSLLITGPGGQGKTSLAGKFVLDLQKQGFKIFTWRAQPNGWRNFEFRELELSLEKESADKYNRLLGHTPSDSDRADFLIELLLIQFNGNILFFFDSLEVIQDTKTLEITDNAVWIFLDRLREKTQARCIVTSRSEIPNWSGAHLLLSQANYGDFLQIAALKKLHIQREQIRHVYDTLGGNIRGLEVFAAAASDMDSESEAAFLKRLEQTKGDLQTNMAIAEIYKHLPTDAKKLLTRLPAYHEPVPVEGLLKLGLDLPNPESLLKQLVAVSLLDVSYDSQWDVTEYKITPMMTELLIQHGKNEVGDECLNTVADYHLYLLENERNTFEQSVITHNALRRAKRHQEANHLVLSGIIETIATKGLYSIGLNEWLPLVLSAKDPETLAPALFQAGRFATHLGDYQTAYAYLEQSLALCQETNNEIWEGYSLEGIGRILQAQGQYPSALSYLENALLIQRKIKNLHGESSVLVNIANNYDIQGQYQTALLYLSEALDIQRMIENVNGEATTLNNISQILRQQGNYKEAFAYATESLQINERTGDIEGQCTTLNNISALYYDWGDYEAAISYLKQALVISQQTNDRPKEGAILNNISSIYKEWGEYNNALQYLEQSLAIAQKIGDKRHFGITLNSIAVILMLLGDYKTALLHLEEAQDILDQIGDKPNLEITINNIAMVYQKQGDYESALSCLSQSLEINRQTGNKTQEVVVLVNISTVLKEQGDYGGALLNLNQALTLQKELGGDAKLGVIFNNLGDLFRLQGNHEKAISCFYDALSACREIGDQVGVCTALYNIGFLYASHGQIQPAILALTSSYMIADQIQYDHILQLLKKLSAVFGISKDINGWEDLGKRANQGEITPENERVFTKLFQIKTVIQTVVNTSKKGSSQSKAKFFQLASNMAVDMTADNEYRELGKIFLNILNGKKDLDLSLISTDVAELIRWELGEE